MVSVKISKLDINPVETVGDHIMVDKTTPTQNDKHIGQVNNFPKKLGLSLTHRFLKPSKMLPKTIIFVAPYATIIKISNSNII
jgi:hypothetical protein